ncbi:N-acetylneuraminate 9-O-acetyltransferase isoform X4 [Microplitis demolitor]|uniref:N-acetylneuraminate 9-O-acetyltransferase isoform X4 n=1 Tax=Microplitis demolitor TaxID=69319 RepID=UPI0004CD6099|nr:N-acetylneuraminate 9-O-acetyltransferase isoform X4 [Microplitis demolitor]
MTAAEHFISLVTVASAKKLAAFLVICFIFYHGMIHLIYGSDSCKWLLKEGRYKGDREWQPYGCMMHHYTQTDSRRCFRYLAFMRHKNHFVFIGDARTRQLCKSFISQFTVDGKGLDSTDVLQAANLNFKDAKLKLEVQFLWRPQLNISMINDFQNWMNGDAPSMIIAGCGAFDILTSNASDTNLYTNYSSGLIKLVRPAEVLAKKGTQFLWMLQDPIVNENLPAYLASIDNKQINICNKAAVKVLMNSKAHLWESSKLIGQGVLEQSPDGYLSSPLSLRHKVQILLNTYCNDYMNFDDGTCCSNLEVTTTLQLVTLLTLMFWIIIGASLWLYKKVCYKKAEALYLRVASDEIGRTVDSNASEVAQNESPQQDFYTLITSLAIFSCILAYFYLCDRTNFFMKENKYYSEFSFWLPLGYILALGLFFTEDCERGPRALNREQTDEWRGLMQSVVLIYHVTGAKNVLPIYMHLRLINSAYLFLSGYGHFCYFWQTGDVSLVRFARVFFEKVFVTRPWKALFVTTDDDIREWWSRWRVDRYSVAFGIAFGGGLLALQRIDHIPGNALTPLIALISLAAYTAFTLLCVSVSECEEIHSYIVFIPIIGYIILRNSSLALKGRYSVLLAGLGKISLETLVGQGHVWLAADTHGVLVLLPRFPVLNLLITSFIFICASHEIHELTLILAQYAVPNDWRLVARNFLVFTAVLVPIGIHDGMF